MQLNSKTLQKNVLTLEVELSAEEMKPFLEKATALLAQEVKIDGFRPEKVPFDVLKQHVGEMTIYEKAAELAVEKTYPKIVKDEHLETLGSPEISILKLAPGNPLVYTATVALVPKIKLGDYHKIKVPRKKSEVSEKKADEAMRELQKMQTKEVLVKRPAGKKDKIVVDMNMFLDKVPLEAGQTKNHAIYLSEAYYVPGLTDQLLGLSAGEEKTFTMPFPTEHFQKNIAGKNIEFKVKVDSVFELQPPELNDAFAKTLGQETLDELKNLIRKNLLTEEENKEEARLEEEILRQVVASSRVEDIPDMLIQSETHKMVHELEDSLAERGINFEDYLKNIKKTEKELMLDFAPRAVERIKTALAIKEIAAEEKIEATKEEIDEEIAKLAEAYKNEPDLLERVRSEESKQYLSNVIKNRKAILLLKDIATKN
jgi:trigger factor